MAEQKPLLGLAHDIATQLGSQALDGPEGVQVLAMAMGIFLEGQEGSHREMIPVARAINEVAQIVFDKLREARGREAGHA